MTKKEFYEKTVPMMLSDDWKERFHAEYLQLFQRCNDLGDMLERYRRGELEFEPKTDYFILVEQYKFMMEYLDILYERAMDEGIDISIGD